MVWPPDKYHLIIHHHLCHESQIAAADLSENSSKKYQSHFGSYRQRTVPRRLCGHASRHYSASASKQRCIVCTASTTSASKQRCIACLRGSSPERAVRA